jgi:hypothetical protein
MCLNCRILNPLSDLAAEIIGVEKRKYLVYGYTLYNIMINKGHSKYAGYNCTLHNNHTIRCFNGDLNQYNKITINGIDLYEGKLKVIKTLPIPQPPENVDAYFELFEGDFVYSNTNLKWCCDNPI